MAYKINKPKRTFGEQAYFPEAAKGLAVTIRRFFKNTFSREENKVIATVQYPDEVRDYPPRFRGVHRLTHRTDGSPRCVACLCCSTACPALSAVLLTDLRERMKLPLGECRRLISHLEATGNTITS